ncbi:C3 and PZP-like alpha-2-macroglobulin domain-containing protein 8 [Amphiura filiformis]|uniref:C3 and PZP-like alpha-2-macroglobulin domain-containing protein 8 n=1 Tax=Amphiura filiformis TaxID=82378 RepID=UPI003B21E509
MRWVQKKLNTIRHKPQHSRPHITVVLKCIFVIDPHTGVTTQYTYRKQDSGSFAYMQYAPESTWLTAFVNKIFCQARDSHFIDPQATVMAMNWLINRQRPDGSFNMEEHVFVDTIRGGLEDENLGNSVAAKTAYVLISLLECNYTAMENHAAVDRATIYLESIYTQLVRPFDKSIVTYALTLAGSEYAENSAERLREIAICDEDTCHWEEDPTSQTYVEKATQSHWNSVNIETTGYALLAQLKLRHIEYSNSIVNWLSQNAGFEYTQDKVVALQALSEYAIWRSGQAVNLHTTIRSSQDNSFSHTVHIHEGNALLQHSIQGPVDGQLIVDTRGKGTGQLAVQIKYNSVDNSFQNCPFDINVIAGEDLNTAQRERRSVRQRHRRQSQKFVSYVNVCTRYLGNARTSNKAVIDVGLYSGFRPLEDTLVQIQADEWRIERYEITNRSVTFFVSEIPNSESLCFTFETIRDYVVGKIQPVAVRVYDYHEPAKDCVKFYSPAGGPAMIASICEGHTCMCAEGKCPPQPCKGNECTSTCQNLLDKINQGNSSDTRRPSTFAYKVSFNRREQNAAFEIIYMNISSAFVIGDDVALGRSFEENPDEVVVRPFWQSLNCRQRVRIGSKMTYLVIGTGGMRFRDDNGDER